MRMERGLDDSFVVEGTEMCKEFSAGEWTGLILMVMCLGVDRIEVFKFAFEVERCLEKHYYIVNTHIFSHREALISTHVE